MNSPSRSLPPPRRATWLAVTLVVLQFGLAVVLVLSTPLPPAGMIIWMLIISGSTLAVWAWLMMGRHLRILPAPDQKASLVDHGPYAWLRHPMYTGLIVEILLPSSIEHDGVLKRHVYESAGVPEYWIVDPFEHTLLQLTLSDGRYQEQTHSDAVTTTFPPHVTVDLRAAW